MTPPDPSFVWVLIQWDRNCQDCNFSHVVNYGFEFYGAEKFDECTGSVQRRTTRENAATPRTKQRNSDIYLLLINTWGRASGPSGLKSCNQQADESVRRHSCYPSVCPRTKRTFKHISSAEPKPLWLTSITRIKYSPRQMLSSANWQRWAHSAQRLYSAPLLCSAAFVTLLISAWRWIDL